MPAYDYSVVAAIYDHYVRTDFDVPFFVEESRTAKGSVLELMCGTGRLSLPLLRSGVSLTCVDQSPDMLTELRRKLTAEGQQAEVVEQDVAALSLERRFTLALLPFNSLSELTSPSDQRSALRSIHACLQPGGRLILTLHNPRVRLSRVTGREYEITRAPLDPALGSSLLVRLKEYHDPVSGLVTGVQTFEAINADGGTLWTRSVHIAFRLVAKEEAETMFSETGFEAEWLFGNYDRSPYRDNDSPYMIWGLRTKNE